MPKIRRLTTSEDDCLPIDAFERRPGRAVSWGLEFQEASMLSKTEADAAR